MNKCMRFKRFASIIAIILTCSASSSSAMKRSASESSSDSSLTQTINFLDLPRELVPQILMYTDLSPYILTLICKHVYAILCCNNHLEANTTQTEGKGIEVCKNYPRLVITNRFDCQRMYYIFITTDDCVGMKQLLELDKGYEQNLAAVIQHCFDKPLEKIVSEKMQGLIYEYSLARNDVGAWCPECARSPLSKRVEEQKLRDNCEVCLAGLPEFHYETSSEEEPEPYMAPFTQERQQIIDFVMRGNSNKLKELMTTTTLETIARSIRAKYLSTCFTYLFHFCSYNTREQLISLIKKKDPDYEYKILLDYRDEAIVTSDYARLEHLVVDHGIDLNISYGYDRPPILIAIERVMKNNEYTLLDFLITLGANLNLDLNTSERGFTRALSDEAQAKLLSYFNQQEIDNLIEEIISPLLHAVLLKKVKLVKTLLKGGVDLSGPQSCPDDGGPDEAPPTDILDIAKALGNNAIIEAITNKRNEPANKAFVDSISL